MENNHKDVNVVNLGENLPRVEDWLSARAESNHTREGYLLGWRHFTEFCKTRNKNPAQLVDDYRAARRLGRNEEDSFLEEWQDMVRGFHSWLKTKNWAPLSVKNHLAVLKSFCTYWKIPLDVDLPKHACVVWHNRDLKAEEVKQILTFATPRDRIIWLVMVESGLRVDNAVNMKYWQIKEDFTSKRVPMKIMLPSSALKDHVGDRWTFIGEDAFRELQDYLERRLPLKDDDYVFKSEKQGLVKGDQFSTASLSVKFNRIVQKLDIDKSMGEKGRPKQIRLHGLRKYFRNNMKADSAFVNFWMGHSLGVDAHYISRDVEEHRKRYAEGYPHLRLYENDPDTMLSLIRERDQKVAKLETEIQELREMVMKQTATMQRLIEKVKE